MTKPDLPEEVRQLNETLKLHPHLTEQIGPIFLLSVQGRISGQLRATGVARSWLVAAFAKADWGKIFAYPVELFDQRHTFYRAALFSFLCFAASSSPKFEAPPEKATKFRYQE